MDVLTLLDEANKAGLTVTTEGGRLRIRGAAAGRGIAEQLGARKAEVLAALERQVSAADALTDDRSPKNCGDIDLLSAQVPVLDQSHPLASFDWDTSPGHSPGRRIVRNGIEHKREDCSGQRCWRHVWGGTYCSRCWPCTDPAAMVTDGGEPT